MPDLATFDHYHLGLSGGKDRSAVLLWLLHEAGIDPTRIIAAFCDTGNEDPLTHAWIALLQRQYAPRGVRFVTLQPERDFWALARHKGRFPSLRARFCTQELKIIPTRTHVQTLLRAGGQVVALNGVRQAEGRAGNTRGSAPAWELDLLGFGTWIHRPIVHWTAAQVLAIHRRYLDLADVTALVAADPGLRAADKTTLIARITAEQLPVNPLYAMGARRVGCFPCVNGGKREVQAVSWYRPGQIAFIAAQEQTVGREGFSSFFRATTVPAHLRSRTVVRGQHTWRVPTVRDVVLWSRTARGGRQLRLEAELPPASACDLGGLCE